MAFALLLIGFLAFVSAYKNTLPVLGGLLKNDFSGPSNFFYWIVALILVGSIGYVGSLRLTSKMLLLLILVVMILSDRGFFSQFVSALNQPAPAPAPEAATGAASSDNAPAKSGGGIGFMKIVEAGVALAAGDPIPAAELGAQAAGVSPQDAQTAGQIAQAAGG